MARLRTVHSDDDFSVSDEELKHYGFDKMICGLYKEFCYTCPQYLCDMRSI